MLNCGWKITKKNKSKFHGKAISVFQLLFIFSKKLSSNIFLLKKKKCFRKLNKSSLFQISLPLPLHFNFERQRASKLLVLFYLFPKIVNFCLVLVFYLNCAVFWKHLLLREKIIQNYACSDPEEILSRLQILS